MERIVIGITEGRLYENYARWISAAGPITLIRLGYHHNNAEALAQCHGLFMTGGEDVYPAYYNKPEYVKQFRLSDLDERRDAFELELLSRWQTLRIPLLGVCRGLQLVNVFRGGTLIPDLPSFGKFNHARFHQEPRYHSVAVDPNSLLYSLVHVYEGTVSSIHHQSIDRAGEGLVASSLSPDGVVESIEWLNPQNQTPIQLVQWHPEIMPDQKSPFVKNILEYFIQRTQDNV
jgi:putative glutamine amidotransferase